MRFGVFFLCVCVAWDLVKSTIEVHQLYPNKDKTRGKKILQKTSWKVYTFYNTVKSLMCFLFLCLFVCAFKGDSIGGISKKKRSSFC